MGVFFTLAVAVSSCDTFKDEITPESYSEVAKNINANWQLSAVSRNGVDITDMMDFTRFHIVLNEGDLIRLKNELGITFVYVTHDQEEALTMSDTIVVMNQGYIQQIGTPEDIYNEPQNAFVADFIGDSNIIAATMLEDKVVRMLGAVWKCVDVGFGHNRPVDAVIRPEDIDLVKPGGGVIDGIVTNLIFKGVHYEMEVLANNYELLVHSTDMFPIGTEVGIKVDPFDIQIMKKPESEDEEAPAVEE